MAKLSNDELLAAIEQEEATAINWADGPLAEQRAEALRRYNRDPYGNEVDGRSQVVSNDVQDTITSIMPSLARVFLSGDEIGKFEPLDPSDQSAEVESEVTNWYLMTKNDGYSVIYAALKDALLLGNSYIKAWWREDNAVKVERYKGLADEELAIILQDRDVEVVEHDAYPDPEATPLQYMGMDLQAPAQPMLHNLKVRRVRADEYVQIAAVPPDEVLVSRTHRETSLQNADFVQHRRTLSIGELTELGYKVDPNISDDVDDENRPESLARDRYQENSLYGANEDASTWDDSRRRVTLRETWIRLGDADNTQTLWRICLVGRTILHKEEADQIPLAAFSPIIYPHSHVGESVYSLVEDIAELNTTITRQYLDNLYLANNARTVVDVDRVNIDDLLVSRPGGIVRVNGGDPASALMPLVTPDVGVAALQALEMLQGVKERRTGIARINQGAMDPNMLNRTATGASLMMSAGQAHLELIARCLAGGVKDLFLITHALALKHSTKPLQIRLQNKWIATNPREWKRRTDFALQVALGTGAPEQQMAKLTAIGQFMTQGLQLGLVTPQNMYEWGKEYLRVAGYRSPDKFLTAPQPGQQPPQQPNPLLQVEQIKQQSEHAKLDKELAFKSQMGQAETQQKAALEQQRMANELGAQRDQAQQDAALAKYKADLDAETTVKTKLIEIAGQLLAQSMAPEPEDEVGEAEAGADVGGQQQMGEMMQALMATVQQLAAASGAPKRIVRGPDGRAVGVETVQPGLQ